ncbi:transcriptional regulator [Aliivibrio fischeri]|nr:transcriptional regulator [Aliivibrio fischeri]
MVWSVREVFMRVLCQCGTAAIISRNNITEQVCELSCSCKDAECGHSFITSVCYKHTLVHSQVELHNGATMEGNRIRCGCGERAVIKKTNRLSYDCADLYCECKNINCKHQFVMSLYYSHTLSPSAKTTDTLVYSLVKALPPQTRHDLGRQLSMF